MLGHNMTQYFHYVVLGSHISHSHQKLIIQEVCQVEINKEVPIQEPPTPAVAHCIVTRVFWKHAKEGQLQFLLSTAPLQMPDKPNKCRGGRDKERYRSHHPDKQAIYRV